MHHNSKSEGMPLFEKKYITTSTGPNHQLTTKKKTIGDFNHTP